NLWRKGGNGAIHEFSFETSHLDISSQRESTSNFLLSCVPGGTGATQSVLGRVFALPNDVVVSVRPSGVCNQLNLLVTDPKNSANNSSYIADVLPGAAITKPVAVALADFDRDGYDDVFFIDARFAQVYTAVCNNDPFAPCTNAGGTPSQGLKLMVQLPLANELYASPPVTGDFNGDGAVDVAWPTFDGAGGKQLRRQAESHHGNRHGRIISGACQLQPHKGRVDRLQVRSEPGTAKRSVVEQFS